MDVVASHIKPRFHTQILKFGNKSATLSVCESETYEKTVDATRFYDFDSRLVLKRLAEKFEKAEREEVGSDGRSISIIRSACRLPAMTSNRLDCSFTAT